MANIKYNIEEINDLQRLGNRDKEELLAEFQTCKDLADRGGLEALYRCFELNAIIELKDCQKIEYDGKAFTYLKEAAQHGYTKAIKVYIVMILGGFDIKVIIHNIGFDSSMCIVEFLDIKTLETDIKWNKHRELNIQELNINFGLLGIKEAERAISWLTDEAKKQPDVKKVLDWIKEKKNYAVTIEEKKINTEKSNKKIFWIMRLVTGIVCVIAGIVAYVLRFK